VRKGLAVFMQFFKGFRVRKQIMKNRVLLNFKKWIAIAVFLGINAFFADKVFSNELPILDFGGDFTLVDHNGLTAKLSDYQGKVVVMSFGFTSCPDICPVTLNQLKHLMSKLGDQSVDLQNLFISIDPKRDTPSVLKEYMGYFDPTFIGLTGKLDEIKNVSRKYHSSFKKHDLKLKEKYVFGHTVSVFLIDKKGQLRGHYKIESEFERLLKDVEALVLSDEDKEKINPSSHFSVKPSMEIKGAWVRALPPTVKSTVAYMTFKNKGSKADQLVGISSPLAKVTEIHESYVEDGIALMRRVNDIVVPANGELKLEPRGLHAMMLDINKAPKEGEEILLTLSFKHAGDVNVYAAVRKSAGMDHSHH